VEDGVPLACVRINLKRPVCDLSKEVLLDQYRIGEVAHPAHSISFASDLDKRTIVLNVGNVKQLNKRKSLLAA
jgi:hypothetical protein